MRNKYNACKVRLDDYIFDSIAESRRYSTLSLLQKAGKITDLQVHPKFELLPAFTYQGERVRRVTYTADFQYIENGSIIVEDVKGGRATQTQLFRLKAKLFKYNYPDLVFRIVSA